MPLRSPRMKRRIFGFHRRVWWPKWTPASSSWRTVTSGMELLRSVVRPARHHCVATVRLVQGDSSRAEPGGVAGACYPSRSAGGSAPRVRRAVDALQALLGHVRVDLRRRQAGMAQQLLDDTQVRAALEQVRGEGVAERMG